MQLYVNDLYGVIRYVKSPKSTGENMLNPGGAVGDGLEGSHGAFPTPERTKN